MVPLGDPSFGSRDGGVWRYGGSGVPPSRVGRGAPRFFWAGCLSRAARGATHPGPLVRLRLERLRPL